MTAKFLSTACALLAAIGSVACQDDGGTTPEQKGRIDRSALSAGVTVTVSDRIGDVSVPMGTPIPEAEVGGGGGDDELEDELEGSVTLMVTNDSTGVVVDLASGTIVQGVPIAPGQWSWALNSARDRATMTFYNQTIAGQALHPATQYTGLLGISRNGYIEDEPELTFPITVIGN